MDQLTQVQRPLTLQLGRFQLSIPRFGRRTEQPRPDTPNVAEININDLEFVRLHSHETYTLNGRTIRLFGANFKNYPVLENRPPPYNEAMRCKTYGPPPEYLSREGINRQTENEARSNIEMPPCYEDLASGVDPNANLINVIDLTADTDNNNATTNNNEIAVTVNEIAVTGNNEVAATMDTVPETISSVIDNLPAIDSDINANETRYNDLQLE